MDMITILQEAVAKGASDIHFIPKRPPMVRIHGEMKALENYPVLTSQDTNQLIYSLLLDRQKKKLEENWELDCSFQIPDVSRFRVNVLQQKDGMGAVLRVIPSKIPTPEDISLPPAIVKLSELPRGMILVTGPTGSGKSTTLACLIELINQKRKEHILSLEDPIEFTYESKNCVVTQREVGGHTHSFKDGLKYALRQDPDVVLVGEMRDLETISAALTIAETGHLVFATLHTTDAAQTIDRIIDVFPPYQQQQVRTQLSVCLQGVVCQQLLPRADKPGRVAAREIMIITAAIANLIREGKTHQIYSAIETGAKFGMISMDKVLYELVKQRVISAETAMAKASNPDNLKRMGITPSMVAASSYDSTPPGGGMGGYGSGGYGGGGTGVK